MIVLIFLFYIVVHVNGLYSIKSSHRNKFKVDNTAHSTFTEKIITFDDYKFAQNFSPLSSKMYN